MKKADNVQNMSSPPSAPKVTKKKSLLKSPTTRPSINQKAKKWIHAPLRYTKDGACVYCGYGPNNLRPTWPPNSKCTLTHSTSPRDKAKFPDIWAKICAQDDYHVL
jgi:hypothetical protein